MNNVRNVRNNVRNVRNDDYDFCYYMGRYTDQDCTCCPYRDNCSGYHDCDDDEDE